MKDNTFLHSKKLEKIFNDAIATGSYVVTGIENLNNIDQSNSSIPFFSNISKFDNDKAHKTNLDNDHNTFVIRDYTKTNKKKVMKDKKKEKNYRKKTTHTK